MSLYEEYYSQMMAGYKAQLQEGVRPLNQDRVGWPDCLQGPPLLIIELTSEVFQQQPVREGIAAADFPQ